MSQMWLGDEPPDPDKLEDIENHDHRVDKPRGGFWTSTTVNGSSAWLDWCRAEQWGIGESTSIYLLTETDADLYCVDSVESYKRLVESYTRTTMVNGRVLETGIDFEELCASYDGLRLTRDGYSAVRWELSAWDCESTVWFSWCFDTVECLGDVQ